MGTIAKNLKEQRQSLSMSQSELSRQSGISQKTISAIELGRIKYPTYQTAIKLADVIGCEPELFIDNDLKGKLSKPEKPKKQSSTLLALKNKLGGK